MSFWKNLFGGGSPAEPAAPPPGEEYKGFVVRATPMAVGSEYQLSGTIEKEIDGALQVYKFVRADRMTSREEAERFAISKGRQIIDEQGVSMFKQNWPKSG